MSAATSLWSCPPVLQVSFHQSWNGGTFLSLQVQLCRWEVIYSPVLESSLILSLWTLSTYKSPVWLDIHHLLHALVPQRWTHQRYILFTWEGALWESSPPSLPHLLMVCCKVLLAEPGNREASGWGDDKHKRQQHFYHRTFKLHEKVNVAPWALDRGNRPACSLQPLVLIIAYFQNCCSPLPPSLPPKRKPKFHSHPICKTSAVETWLSQSSMETWQRMWFWVIKCFPDLHTMLWGQ